MRARRKDERHPTPARRSRARRADIPPVPFDAPAMIVAVLRGVGRCGTERRQPAATRTARETPKQLLRALTSTNRNSRRVTITPEVAGSSPVAPAQTSQTSCKSQFVLPAQAQTTVDLFPIPCKSRTRIPARTRSHPVIPQHGRAAQLTGGLLCCRPRKGALAGTLPGGQPSVIAIPCGSGVPFVDAEQADAGSLRPEQTRREGDAFALAGVDVGLHLEELARDRSPTKPILLLLSFGVQ